MKKILLSMAVAFAAFSCSDNRPAIEAEIANASGKIYLCHQEAKLPIVKDSVVVENGKFKFIHDGKFQGIVALMAEGQKTPFATFMIDSTANKVVVTGDINAPESIVIVGSQANTLFDQYKSSFDSDKEKMLEFIQANPNSIVSAYALYRNVAPSSTSEQLKEYKTILNAALENSTYIQTLNELIAKMDRVAVGQQYIDIALTNPQGEVVSLSSVLAKNKYVLLDFWASWCPPCRKENPNVVAAFKEYEKRGFTVYGVSLDRPGAYDAWVEGIAADGLNWTNVSDLKFWECAPSKEYAVRSIPANFLIASDGTIVASQLHGQELWDKLEELMPKGKKK